MRLSSIWAGNHVDTIENVARQMVCAEQNRENKIGAEFNQGNMETTKIIY